MYLRNCLEFLQKVFLGWMYSFCALGNFLIPSASALRQTARCLLPHHTSRNASKTHYKSAHDKFKTVYYILRQVQFIQIEFAKQLLKLKFPTLKHAIPLLLSHCHNFHRPNNAFGITAVTFP